jgi:hypothetical protein
VEHNEADIPGEVRLWLTELLEKQLNHYKQQSERLQTHPHRPDVQYAILWGNELERQIKPLITLLKS